MKRMRPCAWAYEKSGLALHAFAEMIRKTYGKNYKSGEIDFMVSDQAMSFQSKALLDVFSCKHAACA